MGHGSVCIGIKAHYAAQFGDDTNRVISIGLSFTRKAQSSVRVYAEKKDLIFFLYERYLASKFFHAQVRAQRMGVTADVMARDSQASSGFWDIVQDALADLVRVQLCRCFDTVNYPELAAHCRNLRGELWVCAFPNLFVTIAPAEWKFPMPYFLQAYMYYVVGGAYVMALHMSK